VDGEAREAFDHELAGEAGVPGGAAGGDGDVGGGAEVGVGEGHVAEVDAAGVEGDAAEGGVADGGRLLVDLLKHEVLVAGFFGLDGVPGYALRGGGAGGAVEVGEVDAGGGEGGDVVVGEEVDGAGVVEDAGDVGGEEEFAVAEAEDDGRAHAGGDHLVGLVGGEDADGEGAGHAAGGASHCLFERNRAGDCGFEDGDGFVGVVGVCGGMGGPHPAAARRGWGTRLRRSLQFVLNEVGDDLGVGFGGEGVALGDELVLEGEVVFDDAV